MTVGSRDGHGTDALREGLQTLRLRLLLPFFAPRILFLACFL